MEPAEQVTETREEHYDLIGVLYRAPHGGENCWLYAADAEAGAGNPYPLGSRMAVLSGRVRPHNPFGPVSTPVLPPGPLPLPRRMITLHATCSGAALSRPKYANPRFERPGGPM
jgi:hypothetical protein